jgi:uncharacterized MAPEG superfamily protein
MTVAFWCVLIAFFCLTCVLAWPSSAVASSGPGRTMTRGRFWTLEGFAKRAHSAQLNSFEVTPAFAAAVIIADLVGNAELVTIDVLAVLFITSRLLYIICYLADWAILRSLVWFVGMALIASFFFVSI